MHTIYTYCIYTVKLNIYCSNIMCVADINWYRLMCYDDICSIYCIIILYMCDMYYYSILVCVGWY